jgi:hypothetical protein
MQQGIVAAVIVSLTWVVIQNLLMFVHPAENRFRTMVAGYLFSLPLVLVAYRWLPPLPCFSVDGVVAEAPAMGLFHAYFFHLLLFFFYVQCFYHVERSVTLRLLLELMKHGDNGVPLQGIQGQYPVEGMIQQRLEILRDRGFVELRDGSWHLCFKGALLARVTVAISWLFQSKGQHERS